MLMPSIFGENLFDDFMDGFAFQTKTANTSVRNVIPALSAEASMLASMLRKKIFMQNLKMVS